jgi:hypothetical protein
MSYTLYVGFHRTPRRFGASSCPDDRPPVRRGGRGLPEGIRSEGARKGHSRRRTAVVFLVDGRPTTGDGLRHPTCRPAFQKGTEKLEFGRERTRSRANALLAGRSKRRVR